MTLYPGLWSRFWAAWGPGHPPRTTTTNPVEPSQENRMLVEIHDGTTLEYTHQANPDGGWELLSHTPGSDAPQRLAHWDLQPGLEELMAVCSTLAVPPPKSLDDLMGDADKMAAYRTDADTQAALRRAEDLLEERDAELREAAQDLQEARAEARYWEAVANAREAEVEAVEAHLGDVRDTLAVERARLERLETPPRMVITGAQESVVPVWRCGRIWVSPPGTPTVADVEPCRLPADDRHKAHSDGVYAWNAGTIQRLAEPPHPAECGHLSPDGLGGWRHPRKCVRAAGLDNHRTIGSPDRLLHTDGVYAWTTDGKPVAGGAY